MTADPDHLHERFLTAFNEIDEHLRRETHQGRDISFSRVIEEYANSHRGWSHGRELRRFISLRNALVHDHFHPGQPLALPTRRTTEMIERIRNALLNPPKIVPRFQRRVETATPSENISELLQRVRKSDFSQFPVVANNKFHGLVTENGVTRWLAQCVSGSTLLDLTEHTVSAVLECEENRGNCAFVSRSMLVEDLVGKFRETPDLEAVLITERGDRHATFLGIATRWDIVHLDA